MTSVISMSRSSTTTPKLYVGTPSARSSTRSSSSAFGKLIGPFTRAFQPTSPSCAEVVRRPPARAQQHEGVELGVRKADRPLHAVVPAALALLRGLEADRG